MRTGTDAAVPPRCWRRTTGCPLAGPPRLPPAGDAPRPASPAARSPAPRRSGAWPASPIRPSIEPIVQLQVELTIEVGIDLRVGVSRNRCIAVVLPLRRSQVQRRFPQQADRLDLLRRLPGLALVEDVAELGPAVEHPLAAGRRGFEAADDGLGVVQDVQRAGGRRDFRRGSRALRISRSEGVASRPTSRSLKSRRPRAAASSR